MSLEFLKGGWLKHPLHPLLVHIPVGLWPAAFALDLVSQFGLGGNTVVRLSFFCILFGLVVVLVAVPAGVIDWAGIKQEKPAWRIGLYHMILNLLVAILFAVNLGLRSGTFRTAETVELAPLLLSLAGAVLLLGATYLGGLMVYDHGISVARMSKKRWRGIAETGGANLPSAKE